MTKSQVAHRVAQKEIRLFFASPVAWLFLTAFAAITLFIFFWGETFFARNVADVRPLFDWMPVLLIFLCAAITMRMWSEERRSGTLEHVLTQPANLWQFVWGKFLACCALLLLALLATTPLPITVALIAELDWGPVITGYLATALLGAAYISVGLFVSARTDNPIVSLIGSVTLCGLLYLLGSPLLTDFVGTRSGELLRMLGSGARFESIVRGVIDVRDLCYYLSLVVAFLALNVYVLEQERWARHANASHHRHWHAVIGLVLINILLTNIWLARMDRWRLDVTEGQLYSISAPTHTLLQQLQEPLLIRGYFSAQTHPLLAPLVPQLRDLIREYELAGSGRVKVEFVDPAQNPQLEQEANERFGIKATPFQIADRHQSALVNSYFNVLVRYGEQYQTLGYADLLEVRTAANTEAEVQLRNPEFDLTRAIKDVLYAHQLGAALFDGITAPIEFTAYVSADELLPQLLSVYRESIAAQLQQVVAEADGKFSIRFLQPEANDGALAQQIADQWGFKPMVSSQDQPQEFYFYLTLSDGHKVVQLPTTNFDPDEFRAMLDAGLRRFTGSVTRTVAVVLPPVHEQMARHHLGGPTFINLQRAISREYRVIEESLRDGSVDPAADILAVVAPHQLSPRAVFAIDQFLMRGGTVVLASSPYTAELANGQLKLQDWPSGLQDWLAHHEIEIGNSLVLDPQSAAFPTPVSRQVGGYEFRDVKLIDYPYFIDLRPPGLNPDHPITADLPQLTMAWASPLLVTRRTGRRVTSLLQSSPGAWLSADRDVVPSLDAYGNSRFKAVGEPAQQELAVAIRGRFESYFDQRPVPKAVARNGAVDYGQALLRRSPEAAGIVLFASNDFMDDQMLNAVIAASGTQFLGPIELFMNTLDWSLQDHELLKIRSRGHFNRTLPPMERPAQLFIEYFNYALAIAWLLLLALLHWLRKLARKRHFRRQLGL